MVRSESLRASSSLRNHSTCIIAADSSPRLRLHQSLIETCDFTKLPRFLPNPTPSKSYDAVKVVALSGSIYPTLCHVVRYSDTTGVRLGGQGKKGFAPNKT
jgi:hypothetical protein